MAVASDLPAAREPRRSSSARRTRVLDDVHGQYLATLADQGRIISRPTTSRRRCSTRSSRSRTSASTRTTASTCAASARALWQDITSRQRRPGRLDDHAAVRQERDPGAEPAHGPREDPRGGAGLPPHAQVVQEEDPHGVPQLDLLRQRRLRDRVGRAHVLRQRRRPLRLRQARAAAARASSSPTRPRCWPGMVASPSAYDPVANREAAKRRRNVVLDEDARAGLPHARRVRSARSAPSRCPSRDTIQPAAGAGRRASPSRTSRRWVRQQVVDRYGAREALLGRPARPDDARPRPAARAPRTRSRAGSATRRRARRRRSWRSTTTTGEVRAMVGGTRLRPGAVQPRDAGPAPAGLGVQAVRAGDRAAPRASRRARPGSSKKQVIQVPNSIEKFTVNNYDDNYSGRQHAGARDDVLRQLRLRPGRHQDRHEAHRAHGRADGHPHAGLEQLRDHARRPQAGRHAAGHGPRLPDVRDRRPARHRHARAPASAGPVGIRKVTLRDHRNARLRPQQARSASASCPRTSPTRRRAILESVIKVGTGEGRAASARSARGARPARPRTTATPGSSARPTSYTVAVWVGYPDGLRADAHRVPRRAGRRRHVPGADLARLHASRSSRPSRTASSASASARPSKRARRTAKQRRRRRRQKCIEAGLAVDPTAPARRHDGRRDADRADDDDARRRRRDRRRRPTPAPPAERRPTPGRRRRGRDAAAAPAAAPPPRRRPRRRRRRPPRRRPVDPAAPSGGVTPQP